MSDIKRHPDMGESDFDSPVPPRSKADVPTWFGVRESTLIIAAAAFQVAILAWMTIAAASPLRDGQTVLLRVEPVDPRDLLRGDHVLLGYSFNQVGSLGDDSLGSPAYVTLVPEADGVHYRGELPSIAPPKPGTLYLRGTFEAPGRASFGIETFHVQEGTGRKYEEAIRDHKLWAEIAVSPHGRGVVKRLVIE